MNVFWQSYWKGTFDLFETMHNRKLKWGIVCQDVKKISNFFLKFHIKFWINFYSMVLCSGGSDYYKKNRFFAKTCLGRLSNYR